MQTTSTLSLIHQYELLKKNPRLHLNSRNKRYSTIGIKLTTFYYSIGNQIKHVRNWLKIQLDHQSKHE